MNATRATKANVTTTDQSSSSFLKFYLFIFGENKFNDVPVPTSMPNRRQRKGEPPPCSHCSSSTSEKLQKRLNYIFFIFFGKALLVLPWAKHKFVSQKRSDTLTRQANKTFRFSSFLLSISAIYVGLIFGPR